MCVKPYINKIRLRKTEFSFKKESDSKIVNNKENSEYEIIVKFIY